MIFRHFFILFSAVLSVHVKARPVPPGRPTPPSLGGIVGAYSSKPRPPGITVPVNPLVPPKVPSPIHPKMEIRWTPTTVSDGSRFGSFSSQGGSVGSGGIVVGSPQYPPIRRGSQQLNVPPQTDYETRRGSVPALSQIQRPPPAAQPYGRRGSAPELDQYTYPSQQSSDPRQHQSSQYHPPYGSSRRHPTSPPYPPSSYSGGSRSGPISPGSDRIEVSSPQSHPPRRYSEQSTYPTSPDGYPRYPPSSYSGSGGDSHRGSISPGSDHIEVSSPQYHPDHPNYRPPNPNSYY